MRFEYKVVPAPQRAEKVKGLKTGADRFAHTLAGFLNDLGREGWEYLGTEVLPAEERTGLVGHKTVEHRVMLFRRPLSEGADAPASEAETEPKRALRPDAPEGTAPSLRAKRD